jgi:starch synthase
MPSRFEPCGLNQMYSLRYGTPPLVHATGGLADTVVDAAAGAAGNGFVFREDNAEALWQTMQRACRAWREAALWRRLQRNGMRRDCSWTPAAEAYVALYRRAVAAPRVAG